MIGLIYAGVISFLLISGMFLDAHGWPYSLVGSPIPVKIHPGSYFIFTAFLLLLLEDNPVLVLYRLARARPAHIAYLVTTVGLIAYVILRFGPNGSSFLIDLHLVPVILALLLSRLPTATVARLFIVAILCVTLNGALGIAEYLLQARLTPFLVDGKPVPEAYFRSTALLGHPLQNALITAVTLLMLPVMRDRNLLYWGCGSILAVSLVAFGGRSALAAVLVVTAFSLPFWGMRVLLRRDYSYRQLVGATLAGTSVLGAAGVMIALFGGGTRVFSSIHWDDSANTRIIGLRILDMVSPLDMIFGIGQQGIIERSQVLASYYGIIGLENSWLLLLLIFGAIGLMFFIVALLAWFGEMLAGAPIPAYLGVLGYLIIASTNNTLAAKDSSLIHLVTLVYGARAYWIWTARRNRGPEPAQVRFAASAH